MWVCHKVAQQYDSSYLNQITSVRFTSGAYCPITGPLNVDSSASIASPSMSMIYSFADLTARRGRGEIGRELSTAVLLYKTLNAVLNAITPLVVLEKWCMMQFFWCSFAFSHLPPDLLAEGMDAWSSATHRGMRTFNSRLAGLVNICMVSVFIVMKIVYLNKHTDRIVAARYLNCGCMCNFVCTCVPDMKLSNFSALFDSCCGLFCCMLVWMFSYVAT